MRKMINCICKSCEKSYQVEAWKKTSSYCSKSCRESKASTWLLKTSFIIANASEEEKLKRLKDNFEKLVIRQKGCWDWKGKLEKGYAKMTCRKSIGANLGHIASWIIHNGPIPKGMCVCHHCDDKKCTNPKCLFLGTNLDNVNDMIQKKRNTRGSKVGTAKLNEEKVKEIKILLRDGKLDSQIADEYKVSRTMIGYIKRGKWWSHITI